MNTPNKKEPMGLTLVEAVDTLSNIAELDLDQNMEIEKREELTLQEMPVSYHTVNWLHQKDVGETLDLVKNTFRVILNYLQKFYTQKLDYKNDSLTIERIKAIMVLVGEAARKLDKYTKLFHKAHNKSVTESKEYKKLQEFYQTRISKKIDEGKLGNWVLALSNKKNKAELAKDSHFSFSSHLFIDLDSVKKDSDYELFYIKKEDGSRFFSPKLIRNLKLVTDFGEYINENKEGNFDLTFWRDKLALTDAKEILRTCRKQIEKFYSIAHTIKEDELCSKMRKVLMALMLAAQEQHLKPRGIQKQCSAYFNDYLCYLSELLHSKEYQHLITYPPQKSSKLHHDLLELTHFLCKALYMHLPADQDLVTTIYEKFQELCQREKSEKTDPFLSSFLYREQKGISKSLEIWGNGPIHRVLRDLEEGTYHEFDPLMHQNLPCSLFSLYIQDSIYRFFRWPTPTTQEFINKAVINDEFKAFLRACSNSTFVNKCLIINYQDRTSWKDRARTIAIEDLPNHESFARQTAVLTISKDSEFYHQLASKDHMSTDKFISQIMGELKEQKDTFFIPAEIDSAVLYAFAHHLTENIHQLFFSNANRLSVEQRMDFIELFILFFELKMIELIKPDYIGLVCKDGVDVCSTSAALLFVFVKLLSQERLSENDLEHLAWMLHATSLIYRERPMLPERFNRFISAVKAIEITRATYGRANFVTVINDLFGILYHSPILRSKAVVQRNRDTF